MKIQSVNSHSAVAFYGSIIDSHVHRGVEGCKWDSVPLNTAAMDEFIKQPLNVAVNGENQIDNVKKVLVSSIEGITWAEKQRAEIEGSGKSKYDLKPSELIFEKDEMVANLDMINQHKKDSVYEVMAVCQPSKTNGKADNIRKLLADGNEIAGLKFHPHGLMLNADSELYDDYLALAKDKKLPALFHSQVAVDYDLGRPMKDLNWSDPDYIYALAKRHPDVPVIMGHTGLGGPVAHRKAIDVLTKSIDNNDAKLYAEISWMDFVKDGINPNPENLLDLIKKMKERNCLDRILFGTDAPLGCYGETQKLLHNESGEVISPKKSYEKTISRIKTAIKKNFGEESDSIINKIFYENADELFFIKNWTKSVEEAVPKVAESAKEVVETVKKSKSKPLLWILGSVAVIGSVLYACKDKFISKK